MRVYNIGIKEFIKAVIRYFRTIFIIVSCLSVGILVAGKWHISIVKMVIDFNLVIYLGVISSMIIHEMFHYIVMKKCGIEYIGIEASIYRFSVFTDEKLEGKKLLLIALSGVLSTTLIGSILLGINMFVGSELIKVIIWIYYIHLINILPLFGDGKMILKALFTLKNV